MTASKAGLINYNNMENFSQRNERETIVQQNKQFFSFIDAAAARDSQKVTWSKYYVCAFDRCVKFQYRFKMSSAPINQRLSSYFHRLDLPVVALPALPSCIDKTPRISYYVKN